MEWYGMEWFEPRHHRSETTGLGVNDNDLEPSGISNTQATQNVPLKTDNRTTRAHSGKTVLEKN